MSMRVRSLVGMILLSCSVPVFAAPGDIAGSFDSPARYVAGIAWDGTHLLVSDWRESKIFAVDKDGALKRTIEAPTLNPHGLTFGDGNIWVSDDHTGLILSLNPQSGVVERTFEAPTERAAGLAFADEHLFILAGGKIYRVLPEDGTILGYFEAPDPACRCLAFDGEYLWTSNRIGNELYMLEPEKGRVINIIPAPGPYAAGLAWVDGRLFNADFQDRKIYQLVVDDEQPWRLTEPRRARVEYSWTLSNYGPAAVTDLSLAVALPMELASQKLLSELTFSREPDRRVTDKWGQEAALFQFASVPSGTKAALNYSVEAEVSAIRYFLRPERMGTLDDIPAGIRKQYTADSSRYQIYSPFIQEKVKEIVGDEQNPYWIARKIYDHVADSLEYQMIGGWDIPEVVLRRGTGSCSEYTYTFIALCRAAGLPARYQGSIVVRGDDASVDEAFHRWAQVYLPRYGWVPVDANHGDKPLPSDRGRGFGGLANRFLITTQGGGDSEYLRWGYNGHAQYRVTGFAKVEEDVIGLWEPLEASEAANASVAEERTGCGTP